MQGAFQIRLLRFPKPTLSQNNAECTFSTVYSPPQPEEHLAFDPASFLLMKIREEFSFFF